jgi:hypothetical protein
MASPITFSSRSRVKIHSVRPKYVAQLPDVLKEGVLYICEEFGLTAHKCCCGCGEDVYLKLGPAKWELTKGFSGDISLNPSVGNWKYACKSHYWITNNRVIEAGRMSARAIERVQQQDRRDRDRHVAQLNTRPESNKSFWQRIRMLIVRPFRRTGR